MKNKFTFIDLFAGVGGFRLAFEDEDVGGRCVLTCEWDKFAVKTYEKNYQPHHKHRYVGDICSLDILSVPRHNILLAGFPCQPYSIAGYRDGLNDERGKVFFKILEILGDSKPEAFLLENVKGLLNHDNERTINFILKQLHEIGYFCKVDVLNSITHANIPQNRERVFIVGFRKKSQSDKFNFPSEIKLTKTIHDCLHSASVKPHHIYDNRFDCYRVIRKHLNNPDTIYQWRRHYLRENKSNVCPTLTANMGSGGHNVPLLLDKKYGIRKLTPRECANFQGFPDGFLLPDDVPESRLYHQFGNSVTVPLIKRLAKQMIEVL